MFTKHFDERLIASVSEHLSSRNQKHIKLRTRAAIWKAISKELKTNAKTCRKRWKNLRDCYIKYKKRLRENCRGTKKWKYADLMSFVDNAEDDVIFISESFGNQELHKDNSEESKNFCFGWEDDSTEKIFNNFGQQQSDKCNEHSAKTHVEDKDVELAQCPVESQSFPTPPPTAELNSLVLTPPPRFSSAPEINLLYAMQFGEHSVKSDTEDEDDDVEFMQCSEELPTTSYTKFTPSVTLPNPVAPKLNMSRTHRKSTEPVENVAATTKIHTEVEDVQFTQPTVDPKTPQTSAVPPSSVQPTPTPPPSKKSNANFKRSTQMLFETLATKISESQLTDSQIDALEFKMMSLVYEELAKCQRNQLGA